MSIAAGLVLVAGIAPLQAQHDRGDHGDHGNQAQEHARHPQSEPQHPTPQVQHPVPPPQSEHGRATAEAHRVAPLPQPQRAVVPAQQPRPEREVMRAQPQHSRVVPAPSRASARLSEAQQHQRIVQQQRWNTQYAAALHQRIQNEQQQAARLEQQRRMAQYRFEQAYINRIRAQQAQLSAMRNYENDPYYYTPNIYRYNRGGTYYETNQYGAQSLQRALNYGYQEGIAAGQADRQDGWRFDYRNSYAYQDANYGYDGMYVSQGDYNYYFRQGFERGYQDGYYSRYQYGTNQNGSYSLLGSLVSSILGLQTIR
jgi:hypothetical protein